MLYRLFSRHDIAPRPQDARLGRFSDLLANEDDGAPAAVDPEQDVALIQYTGGTTGLPKGTMLTHQNLTANAQQIAAVEPHSKEGDRIIGVLTLFHVFAHRRVITRKSGGAGKTVTVRL